MEKTPLEKADSKIKLVTVLLIIFWSLAFIGMGYLWFTL